MTGSGGVGSCLDRALELSRGVPRLPSSGPEVAPGLEQLLRDADLPGRGVTLSPRDLARAQGGSTPARAAFPGSHPSGEHRDAAMRAGGCPNQAAIAVSAWRRTDGPTGGMRVVIPAEYV